MLRGVLLIIGILGMVTSAAGDAVGKAGGGDLVAPLVEQLEGSATDTGRIQAARGLKALGPVARPAIRVRLGAMHDADNDLVVACAEALDAIGPAGIPGLLGVVKDAAARAPCGMRLRPMTIVV
jgi:hypothetical protein